MPTACTFTLVDTILPTALPPSFLSPSTLFRSCHYRFLKGAFHERSCILAVDSMSRDGHQVAATSHGITQESQVPVIDVGTVKRDDMVKLPLQGLPHSFNTQHLAWSLKMKRQDRVALLQAPTATQTHRRTVRSQ